MPDASPRATSSDVETRESVCSEPDLTASQAAVSLAELPQSASAETNAADPSSGFRNGVLVGAYARVQAGQRHESHSALVAIDGVETFELTDPDRIGILIEAASLECAHDILTKQVRTALGVLGVWPVSVDGLPADDVPAGEREAGDAHIEPTTTTGAHS